MNEDFDVSLDDESSNKKKSRKKCEHDLPSSNDKFQLPQKVEIFIEKLAFAGATELYRQKLLQVYMT